MAIHHQITEEHIDTFLNSIRELQDSRIIYRAASKQAFENDSLQDAYLGTQTERDEGFLHFSTAKHIEKSVELYCSNISDLILLEVDTHKLIKPEELKWEAATSDRGQDLFPHLYGSLPY